MAKIARKNQKIFAGDVSPTGVIAQFGSLRATTPNYSSDLDVIQQLSAWGDGWASAVISNHFPTLQDLNSLFYVLTKQLSYLMQSGIPEWNETTTYYIGSFVTVSNSTDRAVFISVADDNLNYPVSNTNKWMLYDSRKFVVCSLSTYASLDDDRYIEMTYVGASTVTLPEPTALNKGRKISISTPPNTTGTVTVSSLGISKLIDGSATYVINGSFLPKNFVTFASTGTGWDAIQQNFDNPA
jgi:hypothetical protein